MVKHLNIRVYGKVQGVFYRANAKEAATNLNVKGFTRNEKDGSVYIEAEGEEENLEQFKERCYVFAPKANVDKVVSEEGQMKNYNSFIISY